jgi:hypothetical protein
MFIVGLHFFPLAKLFRHKAHYITGAALVALAVGYPFMTAGGPEPATCGGHWNPASPATC